VRRYGSLWDPPLAPLFAMLAVTLCGLPAAWNSHWMWIDDQIVVGSKLWPPDSDFNISSHMQGRESIGQGLYFKLLSFVLPYAVHVCAIGLAALLVWQTTRAGVATAFCILTAGLAFTGPGYLPCSKQKLPMTLWVLVALLLVLHLMRPDPSRRRGTLVALATATFLSGTLGKENFVVLPLGVTSAARHGQTAQPSPSTSTMAWVPFCLPCRACSRSHNAS